MSITTKIYIDWNDDGDFSDDHEDVTADAVRNVIIDRGRSDVHGGINSGSCEITLRNDHMLYSPEYAAGDLYGNIIPGRKVKVEITYDGSDYSRFVGYIRSFKYTLGPQKSMVTIYCTDILDDLLDQLISIDMTEGETLYDCADAALTEAGLTDGTDYNIDNELAYDPLEDDFSWEDIQVLEILKEITEIGHHFYYVDGDGLIQVKSRHWAENDASYRTYYTSDIDQAKDIKTGNLQYDDENIINDIIVRHVDGDETNEDATSQASHGVKSFDLNYNLMDSMYLAMAHNLAYYYIKVHKDITWLGSIGLKNLYPDCVDMEPGKVITLDDSIQDISMDFIVMGIHEEIETGNGNHSVEMRIQEHTDKTTFAEISATDDSGSSTLSGRYNLSEITQNQESTTYEMGRASSGTYVYLGQQFTTVGAISMSGVDFKIQRVGDPDDSIVMVLADASWQFIDVSLPIKGSKFSDAAGGSVGSFRFLNNPSLAAATQYSLYVMRTGSFDVDNYYKVVAKTGNPYGGGPPGAGEMYYYEPSAGWTIVAPGIDVYFVIYKIDSANLYDYNAQIFAGAAGLIGRVQFELEQVGAGSHCYAYCFISAKDAGTGLPVAPVYATSNKVLITSKDVYNFAIACDDLSPGTDYALCVSFDIDEVFDDVDYQMKVYYDSDNYAGGYRCTYARPGGPWVQDAGNDLYFKILGW